MLPDVVTIPALLAARRAEHPDLDALVSDDDAITYAELDERSRALAARLVAGGASKGARIGLVMPNGIDWAVAAMAVLRTGAVLVPLSTLLRPPELAPQLRTAAVTHLVAVRRHRGRDHLGDAHEIAAGIPSLRHVWAWDAMPDDAAPEAVTVAMEAAVRPADDMVIMFTSGSRGAPKGVVHTHGGALRATAAGLESRRVGPRERLYIPMPFFWMGGFGTGLLSVLVAGATLLTEATPEPASTIAFLERERVTLFRGWPEQAARIAAHPDFATADLSSLRPASLSAVLPADQRAKPGARANLFGMTESFGPYCGARLDLDLPPAAHGSCGRPFDGVDVRIVDGEIQLRSPNLMRGFCGRQRSEVFTADGFYPTGDLGRIDDDGYLFYEGRRDDMFKVKGATVYPTEVEAALRTIPGVQQVHVTDVDGAVGAAVISSIADLDELRAAARERLSSFKVPTVWALCPTADEVPMLAAGKVDKAGLQKLLRSARTPAP